MSGGPINPYSGTGAFGLPTQQASFRFWASPVYTASDGTLWCPGFDGPTVQADRSGIFRMHVVEFLPPLVHKPAVKTPQSSVGNKLDAPTYPTPGKNPANLAPR